MNPTPSIGFNLAFSIRWWSFISSTRLLLAALCDHFVSDAAFSDRVALAAHELLENALKYSREADGLVNCQLDVVQGQLWLRVRNAPDTAHLETLRSVFRELDEGDPLDVYLRRMEASVSCNKSELGLARLRYETGAELDLEFEGGFVTVMAGFAMPQPEGVAA